MKRRKFTDAEKNMIAQVYKSGKSAQSVKAFFSVSNAVLYSILDEYNVPRHNEKVSDALKKYNTAKAAAAESETIVESDTVNNCTGNDIRFQNTMAAILHQLETISTQQEEIIGVLDRIAAAWK